MLSFSLISLIYFIYFSPPSFSPISLSFSLSLSLPLLPFLTLRPSYPVSLSPSLALPRSISLVPPSPASLPILPFHPPPLSLSVCLFPHLGHPPPSLSFPFAPFLLSSLSLSPAPPLAWAGCFCIMKKAAPAPAPHSFHSLIYFIMFPSLSLSLFLSSRM